MPPDRTEWATAYAKQSQSDYMIYEEVLSDSMKVAECHRLHYLQMACEKIAKAYRFRDTQVASERLQTSHVAFSEFIENYLKSPELKARYKGRDAMLKQVARYARGLAREIEKLAPAVDRESSPQNAEYPWEDGEQVAIPCEYSYPNLQRLKEPGGREFLKLIKTAIVDFDQIHIR